MSLRLVLLHPELPSCESCQAWLYDENWQQTKRAGQPLSRPKGCTTPCWKCPKSKDDKPNPDAELSAKNWQAYTYYRQCQADTTGILPRDLTVVKNNAIIRAVEEQANKEQSMMSMARMMGVFGKGKSKR